MPLFRRAAIFVTLMLLTVSVGIPAATVNNIRLKKMTARLNRDMI